MKAQKDSGRRLEAVGDAEDVFLSKQNGKQRSRLHTASTMSWMRKRFSETANKRYLLYPYELKRHTDINLIFRVFDNDGSSKPLALRL